MQNLSGLVKHVSGSYRQHLQIQDHPVFQALPTAAQTSAETENVVIHLSHGEALPDDNHLYFVLYGVIGLFPRGARICVSAVVAGSVHGWDYAFAPGDPRPVARALTDTRLSRVPSQTVIQAVGREWLTQLVARQAAGRINMLSAEAACNASHMVLDRLAKWLVRLHCGANGAPLRITQADFGAMLGVQRTSINAAAKRLQDLGLVRFGRGKVQVLKLDELREISCGCGNLTLPPLPAKRDEAKIAAPASAWSSAIKSEKPYFADPARC